MRYAWLEYCWAACPTEPAKEPAGRATAEPGTRCGEGRITSLWAVEEWSPRGRERAWLKKMRERFCFEVPSTWTQNEGIS